MNLRVHWGIKSHFLEEFFNSLSSAISTHFFISGKPENPADEIYPDYLYLCSYRGRCPRKPLPAERARGRGVFHSISLPAGCKAHG